MFQQYSFAQKVKKTIKIDRCSGYIKINKFNSLEN